MKFAFTVCSNAAEEKERRGGERGKFRLSQWGVKQEDGEKRLTECPPRA